MVILKIGGGSAINLAGIVADMAELADSAGPFIIVHGANALRDSLAEQLGTPKQVVTSTSGYSSVLSDQHAIDVILMSYAGLRNKRLVELCQREGINAVGLTGLDGRAVNGERNKGIRVRENNKNIIKRDFSGKARTVNGPLLTLLLDNGYTPVLTIPIADERGYAVNSENDDIVNALQAAIQANTVVQFIEAPGFLEDAADDASALATMERAEVAMREQQVEGRMKRKMLALRTLVQTGVERVIIADGRTEHPLRDALNGRGTHIS
ncbi:MAG: [LysW]-aminoadipate kinase [Pseudomonadota bacterium]